MIDIPLEELRAIDTSDKNVEKMARGFILGSQHMARRKEIRGQLEDKVVRRIGKKGRYLTDKLFELIEGVSIVDKKSGADGRTIRYYTVPPNLNAIIYALDRVLGKPAQHIDKTEEKKGILVVEHIIKNLVKEPYGKNENGVRKNIESGGSTGGGDVARALDRADVNVGVSEGAV